MTEVSENFEGAFFFQLIFIGLPFLVFFFFQNTKSSSQIWIKISYGIFKSCFQILVFDKRQVKCDFKQEGENFKKKYERA